MNIKAHILFLLLICSQVLVSAQQVTITSTEQKDQKIYITYDLSGKAGKHNVKLYVSADNGKNWEGPLRSVSGDVGPLQTIGTNKQIVWDVLKDRDKFVGDWVFGISIVNKIRNGQVNISGKPENSKVYINNEVIGYTPITLKTLLVDSYELKIQRKDHVPFEKRITIQENKITYINYELKKFSSKSKGIQALKWTSIGISIGFIAYGTYCLIESQNSYNNYYNATTVAASLREKDIALRKTAAISFSIGATMVLPSWLLTKKIMKNSIEEVFY